MELIVEPISHEHLDSCIKNEIKNIILPLKNFSIKSDFRFDINEIKKILKQFSEINFVVKINAILFEHDLSKITEILLALSKMKVTDIIFQDLAIPQIIKEQNLNFNLRYNPETLVVSYGQFDFFNEVNFSTVTLARELTLNEIKKICTKKKNIQVEIQGHGFGFIMHSRWNLISNFETYYNTKINKPSNQHILIQEELRKYPNKLVQDEYGTLMLTSYCNYTIDLMYQLSEIEVDFIRLDFYGFDSQYAIDTTNLYMIALNDITNNKKINECTCKLLNNKDFVYSHGFLKSPKDILDLTKKTDTQNENK